jgi:hypothetical protein
MWLVAVFSFNTHRLKVPVESAVAADQAAIQIQHVNFDDQSIL